MRPEPGQITHHSYTKETRQVETRSIQLGKYRLMYKLIDQTKERDGVQLPHLIRQIEANPGAPMNLIAENAPFEETLESGKN